MSPRSLAEIDDDDIDEDPESGGHLGPRRGNRIEAVRLWWVSLPTNAKMNAALGVAASVASVVLFVVFVTSRSTPSKLESTRSTPGVSIPIGPATTSAVPTTGTGSYAGPPPLNIPPAASPPGPAKGGGPTRAGATGKAPGPTPAAKSGGGASGPAPSGGNSTPAGGGATAVSPSGAAAPGAPVCHNSTDSACGAFRYEPAPGGNQALSIDVSPTSARAGEAVTFHITVRDPDDQLSDYCSLVSFDADPGATFRGGCAPPECPTAYGPWTPPAAAAGQVSKDYTHTYSSPGTYSIFIKFVSGNGRCNDPYSSANSRLVTVTVT